MNMDLCAAAVHGLAQLEVVSTFGQANLAASKYFTSHSKIWQTGSENWKHKKLIRNCNEMASSLLSFRYVPSMPSLKQTSSRPSLQIRAQCFRDEGSVDGNMSILRERIEEVRIKERLERCCRIGNGWNYATGNDYKHKRSAGSSQFFEVFGMVFGTLGLTIVTGSLCLWLVSLFIQYLYQ